jgi:multiple sugar transport system permease protein
MLDVATQSSRTIGGVRTRHRHRRRRREGRVALIMASPALAGLLLFVVTPFVISVVLSLFNARLGSARPATFFGWENYRRILFDEQFAADFRRALLNNTIFAVVVVPLQTALALALALWLNRPLRGIRAFRTVFFMPVVFPMALVAIIWKLIYSRSDDGMLNAVISTVTFGHIGPQDWLGQGSTALPAIILLSIWQGVGFQMVIILAGLQGISPALYEAATIDGAGPWLRFLAVTIPGLRNTLYFVVMVTSVLAFRLFDQVYILTRGGPQNATTTVMYQAESTAFDAGNVGRAAAMTVVLFVIVLVITLLQRRFLPQEREVA